MNGGKDAAVFFGLWLHKPLRIAAANPSGPYLADALARLSNWKERSGCGTMIVTRKSHRRDRQVSRSGLREQGQQTMQELKEVTSAVSSRSEAAPDLLTQYGCGPIRFSGHNDALYERHLLFDDIIAPATAGARERFEAVARSVRDVLSQRWVLTKSTYARENPKRIYYLSMEFLIGRSLSNNVMNLLLDLFAKQVADQKNLIGSAFSSKNPMPGWETAVSGAWQLVSSTRWRRCNCRPWAMVCVTNMACSTRIPRIEQRF